MTSLNDLFSITMIKMCRADGSGAPANTAGDGGPPGFAKFDGAERDGSEQPVRITKTKLSDVSFAHRKGMVVPAWTCWCAVIARIDLRGVLL